jgi:transposase
MKYTPKEISKIACVHLNTVMNWIKGKNKAGKKLIAYKKGGRWIIDKSELIKFLGGE